MSIRVAILTISDSVSRHEREDRSGPALVGRCRELGWQIISTLQCSDEPSEVRSQLRDVVDAGRTDVVLTTGGTGLGPRDSTPEATLDIAERTIPGIAEEIRRKGAEKTAAAVLSRGVAVVRHKTIVINLPGSPKGALESLEAIAELLPHAVEVLRGAGHD